MTLAEDVLMACLRPFELLSQNALQSGLLIHSRNALLTVVEAEVQDQSASKTGFW